MSFEFSAGDFIAVGTLIKDISSCLREAGGSKDDYQELLRELESLQRALSHLDKLQIRDPSLTSSLESVKCSALICRRPLEDFLRKIKKFDNSLGAWSQKSSLKGAADKLRWGFGQKDEIRRLQSYLDIHIQTINMQLAEYGI